MADRGVSDQAFQVRLHHRDQRAINDPDHGEREKQRHRLDRDGREQRNRKAQKAVRAHLEHHARQNHRTRRGRLGMRVGQPGMQRPHRHLDRERQRERGEQPAGLSLGQRHLVEQLQVEAQTAECVPGLKHQVDDRGQHQQRSGHREQHEFDRGVNLAPVAPDSDEEVHRDQHHFPENVEQENVDRQQRAQKSGLEHQHEKAELARPFSNIAAGRVEQRQRNQDGSQQDEQQADSVNAEMVGDSELRNPVVLLDELKIRRMDVEPGEQVEA